MHEHLSFVKLHVAAQILEV